MSVITSAPFLAALSVLLVAASGLLGLFLQDVAQLIPEAREYLACQPAKQGPEVPRLRLVRTEYGWVPAEWLSGGAR